MSCLNLQSSNDANVTGSGESLRLDSVSINETGWYTCKATNANGFNHRSAWLTVKREFQTSLPNIRKLILFISHMVVWLHVLGSLYLYKD